MELTRDIILERLEELRPILAEEYGVNVFGLVGSYARGDAADKSDIDITYARSKEAIVTLLDISAATRHISDVLDISVDLIDWDAVKPHYKTSMTRDLVRFYG